MRSLKMLYVLVVFSVLFVAGQAASVELSEGDILVARGKVLVAVNDAAVNDVMKVDPDTGAQTVISGTSRGSGPLWSGIDSIAIESASTVIVNDEGALYRVQLPSGARTVVATPAEGFFFNGSPPVWPPSTPAAASIPTIGFWAVLFALGVLVGLRSKDNRRFAKRRN